MRRNGIFFSVFLLLVLFFAACSKFSDTENGLLKVSVTDAPFPFDFIDSAIVSISGMDIRLKDDDEESFVTIMEDSVSLDLMKLRNGLVKELVNIELEPGKYDLVRIYISEASLYMNNGFGYTLKVPSGSTTGIKVFIKPDLTISSGLLSDLLLDFNLEESFVLKGSLDTPAGITGFSFKPVIRAINNSFAGSVYGTIRDAEQNTIANAEVWLMQDSLVASTTTDSLGTYMLLGIVQGTYNAYATAVNTDTAVYEQLKVEAANSLELNLTLNTLE